MEAGAAAVAAVFGLAEAMGQVMERLGEGIPPKRHENVDNDPSSSSSCLGRQRADYPVQQCPQPRGDWLNLATPKDKVGRDKKFSPC